MPFLSSGGVRLHYTDSGGGGDCVVFSHGYCGGARQWEPQLRDPSLAHLRLVTWDMRGHGRSDSPQDPAQYGKHAQVADLRALLEHLGVRHAVLVGHSMGAYDHLLFYLHHPEYVRALVLYASGPGYTKEAPLVQWNKNADAIADAYEKHGRVGGKWASLARDMQHRSTAGLALAARHALAQRHGDAAYAPWPGDGALVVARRLGTIAVPALIIVGELDKGFQQAAQMMEGKLPNVRPRVVLQGAGHMANVHKPAEFNAALMRFVASLPAGGAARL